MIHAGIVSASHVSLLVIIDTLIAASIQAGGCPRCHGALHAAHYHRKPRGHVELLEPAQTLRLSWCCSREGCRRRLTTPSLRFLGRKVFTGPTILAVLCSPANSQIEAHLRRDMACSRTSIGRWRHLALTLWETTTGRIISGWLPLRPEERHQPRSVLAQWIGPWPYLAAMWHLLIHPLSGGRSWEVAGNRQGPLDAQNMGFWKQLTQLQTPSCTR
jgi:hypothetical protein